MMAEDQQFAAHAAADFFDPGDQLGAVQRVVGGEIVGGHIPWVLGLGSWVLGCKAQDHKAQDQSPGDELGHD